MLGNLLKLQTANQNVWAAIQQLLDVQIVDGSGDEPGVLTSNCTSNDNQSWIASPGGPIQV